MSFGPGNTKCEPRQAGGYGSFNEEWRRELDPELGYASSTSSETVSYYGEETDVLLEVAKSDDGEDVQSIRSPTINKFRVVTLMLCFFNLGAHDACFGALLPSIQSTYALSYRSVSTLFLTTFLGFAVAGVTSDAAHVFIGRRGIAIFGPAMRLLCYGLIALRPPFWLVTILFGLIGFGDGLLESAWSVWTSGLRESTVLLSMEHGIYGIGAILSPTLATLFINRYGKPWHLFFLLLVIPGAIELILGGMVFWRSTAAHFRASFESPTQTKGKSKLMQTLRHPVTWFTSLFLLLYVGSEVSLGSWLVTFMLRARHASALDAGLVATSFWSGIAAGRLLLGFVTARLGEPRAVAVYILLAIAMHLTFWLVPGSLAGAPANAAAAAADTLSSSLSSTLRLQPESLSLSLSALSIGAVGFFIGPLFPAAVLTATRKAPRHLHLSVVGLASAVGSGGAALLPVLVGALAEGGPGVSVLMPVLLGLLVACLGLWAGLVGVKSQR